MRALSASELLDLWEEGSAQPLLQTAIMLLSAACPEMQAGELARLSAGQRDALLLALRQTTFGTRIAAIASCPDCSKQLELSFSVEDLRLSDCSAEPPEPASLAFGDYELCFRLPNSTDLLAIGERHDARAARDSLIAQCVLSARKHNEEVPVSELPESVLEQVEEQMSKLDPQANVELALDCPECRRSWNASFDILGFFWSELSAWARRLFAEVHALASAYGWSEADILEMSAVRRGIYLGMVGK